MDEKLLKKLNKVKKGSKTKAALSKNELLRLIDFLEADTSILGLEKLAIILFLVTTGLRAFELCSLKWEDVEYYPEERKHTVSFMGKGLKEAEQEVYAEAVKAANRYFHARFGREPRPEDHLVYTGRMTPLTKETLWNYLQAVGAAAREAGVYKRKLQFSAHLCNVAFQRGNGYQGSAGEYPAQRHQHFNQTLHRQL